MAGSDDLTCVGPLFLLIGLFLIYGGATRFLLFKKISDTPTSKVRSAALGLVELFGRAVCRDEMASPVSKAKCVYWRIKAEYYVPGKNGGWRDMYSKSSSVKFFLEDDTGRMLIEPEGAEIDIPSDFTSQGWLTAGGIMGLMQRKTLDRKVLAFLDSEPPAKAAFTAHSGYDQRLTESFIAENDPLYVFGTASPWKTGSELPHEDLIVKQGGDKVMYISDSNEYKALEKIRNSMLLSLAIGFALSAIGLYALLTVFGV